MARKKTEMHYDQEAGRYAKKPGKPRADYTNFFEVGYNAYEFLIDFGQYFPGEEKPKIIVRMITSPVYAKAFYKTLEQSLQRYETTFGAIQEE